MTVRIVDDDNDWSVNLDLDSALLQALMIQVERGESPTGRRSSFPGKFEGLLRQLLGEALDSDIKPPTEPQLKFAVDIARALGVAIPGEALRYRGSMKAFISRFEPMFRGARQRSRCPPD
jgi:hypothetical protein